MKPNVFLFKNLQNEDHLTNSLAFILNLFQRELGDRFLNKIEGMSGLSQGALGKFKSAEFTGFELQSLSSTSKPDMIIKTTTTQIYFENKLSAPLSARQLERHLTDVRKQNGRLIFISQLPRAVPRTVARSKYYIKPSDQDHFFWPDFESVFARKSRKGTLSESILADFRSSLRLNGIRGRLIKGANDNLYTNGSSAEKVFLDELKNILVDIGFKAWYHRNEFTLRVYLKKTRQQPLLNPRLYASGEWLDPTFIKECIIVHCFFDHCDMYQVQQVRNLKYSVLTMKGVEFKVSFNEDSAFIYIPLKFRNRGNPSLIDWTHLQRIWLTIFKSTTSLVTK